MLRGNKAKMPKEVGKGLSPNFGKKNYIKFTNKRKQLKKKTLQTLQETKSATHQAHHYPTLAHTLHSYRNKTKQTKNKNKTSKTSQAQKIKKRYIFTLLGRKYVVFQSLSKCFEIKRQLISLGKEFQKNRSRCFHSFGC